MFKNIARGFVSFVDVFSLVQKDICVVSVEVLFFCNNVWIGYDLFG